MRQFVPGLPEFFLMTAAAVNSMRAGSGDQCTCQLSGPDSFVRLSTVSFDGYEEVRKGYVLVMRWYEETRVDFVLTVAINSYWY